MPLSNVPFIPFPDTAPKIFALLYPRDVELFPNECLDVQVGRPLSSHIALAAGANLGRRPHHVSRRLALAAQQPSKPSRSCLSP